MTYFQLECLACERFAISLRDRDDATHWAERHVDGSACTYEDVMWVEVRE